MATKSFVTEFKFNSKSGYKLINAIENSKKSDRTINQKVTNVTEQKDIDRIMSSFLGE
jgi:hypothetical protein